MRISALLLIALSYNSLAQDKLVHIDPPFWWTNMPTEQLQIMLHGERIGSLNPELDYKDISFQVERLENPNYLVLYLEIPKNTPS